MKRKDTKVYAETFGCCVNHTGKMTGLYSYSTSCLCNDYCKARLNNKEMICGHCFSAAMQDQYKALTEKLIANTNYITSEIINPELFPVIKNNVNMFRFESFGELVNEIQVVNYFAWAAKNRSVNCALWTKNPWIIENAMRLYGIEKPGNLTIIGSSYFLNKPMVEYYKKYSFIDHVFTVYEPEYTKENNIFISCGARSCATCKKCYCGFNSYEISELLK